MIVTVSVTVYTDYRPVLRGDLGEKSRVLGGDSLEEFLKSWQAQSGIRATLAAGKVSTLAPGVQLQLLRILQEALSNVRKHSGSAVARIVLSETGDRLVATVEDDGVGFDPAEVERLEPPRFGLTIMRERAESFEGRLEIDSRPGAGTTVTIEVPLAREMAAARGS